MYIFSFRIFCSPIEELWNGTKFRPLRGGAQKGTKKNRFPVADSTIDSFVQNGLPWPCGKGLQVVTRYLGNRDMYLQNRWQVQLQSLLPSCSQPREAHQKFPLR